MCLVMGRRFHSWKMRNSVLIASGRDTRVVAEEQFYSAAVSGPDFRPGFSRVPRNEESALWLYQKNQLKSGEATGKRVTVSNDSSLLEEIALST